MENKSNKKTTVIILIALVVLFAAAALLYNSLSQKVAAPPLTPSSPASQSSGTASEPAAQPESGSQSLTPAPDFTAQDADGNSVSLSDYIGKPIVLNFWASWCGPCKSEMPTFDAVAAEMGEDVQFLMVNMTDGGQETVETASDFIAEQGYTFPVFYDTDYEAARAYAVRSIPVTYFIDTEGNLQGYSAGSMSEDTLRQGIALIAE